MAFYNKVKWVLGILMVFILIISTNLIDRNNFLRVRDLAVDIYEDRLVAKDLIFDISKNIQEKEIAVALTDTSFFLERNDQVNSDIKDLVVRFYQTELTRVENNAFRKFKQNFESLRALELEYALGRFLENDALVKQFAILKEDLDSLSDIQMSEGKRKMTVSIKAMDTVELFTQMEIYMLILIAILIQVIIIYKPKIGKEE